MNPSQISQDTRPTQAFHHRLLHRSVLTLSAIGALVLGPGSVPGLPSTAGQVVAAPLQLNLQQVSLKGGLKGEVLERHAVPLVTLQLTFRTGSAMDPVGREGLDNLVVEGLRAGAGSRDAKGLAEALDALGAEFDATVTRDAITLRLEVMSRDLPQAVGLLSDLVTHATFPAEELERIRRQVAAGLQDRLDNPAEAATAAFYEQLYQTHPYAHSEQGNLKSVASITREDVLKHYSQVFRPENAWFIAIGDFKTKELKSLMDKGFAAWPNALKGTTALATRLPAPARPLSGQKVVLVHRPGLTQAQIRIGNVAVSASTPGVHERLIANTALGGGFTSRLVEEIRVNRSLSYGARSTFFSYAQPGPFLITTFTKNETVGETLTVALETVKTFKEKGMQDAEFGKARAYSAGQFAQTIQEPEGLAGWLARMNLYALPADFVTTYADRLRAIQPNQLGTALEQVPLNDRLIVVYADKTKVLDQLKGFGQVCVVEQVEFDPGNPGECAK